MTARAASTYPQGRQLAAKPGGKMNRHVCTPLFALLLVARSRAAPPAAAAVSLAPGPGSPMAVNAYAVALADVNSDQHLDLIVTAEHLQVFLGDGSGRF